METLVIPSRAALGRESPVSGAGLAAKRKRTQFRDRSAILPRIGRAEIHASSEVPLDRLSRAHAGRGIIAAHDDLMPERRELLARGFGNARLEIHIAAGEGFLREAGRVHGALHIHSEIDHVRDELRMRLRLVPAAHDTERDADVTLFHEGRYDGVD